MKVFTLLLLASLASTSLAILPVTQVIPSKHPRKDHVSNEDLSKEPFTFSQKMIAEENMEIKPPKPKSQYPMQPSPIPQGKNLRDAMLQSEETTELTPRAATTSEEKKAKLSHKIKKNLDKIVKPTTIHGQIIEELNP
ncbi:glycosylation-dependent cell adhesion molecule 1-like [Octodon degus]|uniref:Glycosylation-dependent cell adhesion molecule 1 n=1 Tax=Octodon degus TaxID=10160 RepID=A0A6P3VC88_OCTDE|nr:glycosylation-dependent cell adhesion molecule 1-like [Octodon degus]